MLELAHDESLHQEVHLRCKTSVINSMNYIHKHYSTFWNITQIIDLFDIVHISHLPWLVDSSGNVLTATAVSASWTKVWSIFDVLSMLWWSMFWCHSCFSKLNKSLVSAKSFKWVLCHCHNCKSQSQHKFLHSIPCSDRNKAISWWLLIRNSCLPILRLFEEALIHFPKGSLPKSPEGDTHNGMIKITID